MKMADVGLRHVTRVTLFRNGDPNFNGKHIVVNPRYYRNFESFLDTATFSTQCTSAVTRICTPLGRHNIESVDQLSDGGTYVAVGRENFKRLKYGQPRPRKVPVRLPPVWRNHLPSSGRFRKVYEGEKQALKRIYAYRNGDNITPARMILLKRRMLTDMELVLGALQDSGLKFDFAISKLFTLNGREIHDCDEIVHDGKYVAVERGSRFKSMNYGGHVEMSPRNTVVHPLKLPPLVQQNNNPSVNRSPKKQIVKPPSINKPRPLPVKPEKNGPSSQTQPVKKRKENKRSGVPNQKSIVAISLEDNRESFSNVSLSATPPPLNESPDFTLSAINKAKESGRKDGEKLPEIGDIPLDIDELPKDEQETIGAHIYKASGMQREWGDMVKDSRNTPVKTLDDAPAEEVVEEITEDIEDGTETSEAPKEIAKTDEGKVMEIVEEVVASPVRKGKDENDEKKERNDETAKQERSASEASKDNDDQSDEESEKEEKDDDSVDEMASSDDDDTTKVDDAGDDDKVHDSDAVDNDEKKAVGADKNILGAVNKDKGSKDDSGTGPAASGDDDNENDDDEEDDDKDESPAVSQNPSRRSSQEMNSEDEVKSEDEIKSEDEVDEEDDEKDDEDDEKDDDDDEDEKSEEEEESEDDKDEEEEDDDKEDEDDDSSVASEPEDDASNTDPDSEKEDQTTEKYATKENKTNEKVEKQRAQPDVSTKKKGKPDMTKGRSTKTRDVNKA